MNHDAHVGASSVSLSGGDIGGNFGGPLDLEFTGVTLVVGTVLQEHWNGATLVDQHPAASVDVTSGAHEDYVRNVRIELRGQAGAHDPAALVGEEWLDAAADQIVDLPPRIRFPKFEFRHSMHPFRFNLDFRRRRSVPSAALRAYARVSSSGSWIPIKAFMPAPSGSSIGSAVISGVGKMGLSGGFCQVSRQRLSGGTDQPWRAVSSSGDGDHIAEGGDPLDIDRPSTGRGHVLLAPGGRSEEVAHFVVGQAEAGSAGMGLKTSHRPEAPFYHIIAHAIDWRGM